MSMESSTTKPHLIINQERLSPVLKGTFSEYYGQQLTPTLIEELTKKMMIEFEVFINSEG